MIPWPRTDVLGTIEVSGGGCRAEARTNLYLQGARLHIHTTTILIAVDQLLARLLGEGEALPDVVELQNRNLSNRDLDLTVADSAEGIRRERAPALRGSFRTRGGRTFFVEAAVGEAQVTRREPPAGIFAELMEKMHPVEAPSGVHRTRLAPLAPAWAECEDAMLGRHAIVEFVLEGTRQPVFERFGDPAGTVLVVAGWKDFTLPPWERVAAGCVLEYRLSDGRLSSGAGLVHCDFSFCGGPGAGRLTIASAPAARMTALEPRPRPPSAGPAAPR